MDGKNYVTLNPNDIESQSFEIISKELGDVTLLPETEAIVKRVIHTTADFEYARLLEFHPQAVTAAIAALSQSADIYCDTKMIEAGVNKASLSFLGSKLYTYIDNAEVKTESQVRGITRSIIGVEKTITDAKTKIYIVGNAPTALVRITELVLEKKINPALIIGVPVGFVGAAESKEFVKQAGVPYIISSGRKGGSTVAVAILNALLYKLKR